MTSTMGGEIANFKKQRLGVSEDIEPGADYLTVYLEDQIFGIPVLQIQDVLREMDVTRVPLAPAEIAGALNLRGRIVTAVNVRKRLGLSDYDGDKAMLSVVVEYAGELFSLVIDRVGDVISISDKYIEQNPATLDNLWRDISTGIYRIDERLMIIMDVSKLLETVH